LSYTRLLIIHFSAHSASSPASKVRSKSTFDKRVPAIAAIAGNRLFSRRNS